MEQCVNRNLKLIILCDLPLVHMGHNKNPHTGYDHCQAKTTDKLGAGRNQLAWLSSVVWDNRRLSSLSWEEGVQLYGDFFGGSSCVDLRQSFVCHFHFSDPFLLLVPG